MLCVVRKRSLRRTDHPSKRVLPSMCYVVVWSRNLKNEEAMARVGPQRHRKKKFQIIHNLSPFVPFLTQKWINLNYCGRRCMSIFQYVSPSKASGTFMFSFESRTYTETYGQDIAYLCCFVSAQYSICFTLRQNKMLSFSLKNFVG